MDTDEERQERLQNYSSDLLAETKIFPLIASIKRDVIDNIDSALSWDQLTAADINFAIVRPLIYKYARLQNLAVVYACLAVRAHFQRASDHDLAHQNVMDSRAMMCELLAIKLVRDFAKNQLELATVLITSWSPVVGAPKEVVEKILAKLGGDEEDLIDPKSALEIAIETKSKRFLATTPVQSIVNDIYAGTIVFTASGHRSLLADNYKIKEIQIHDGSRAGFLDHYRLRVPKYGAILEFFHFAILVLFFCLCLSNRTLDTVGQWEAIFVLFAFAFLLEEYAQAREHGWGVYIASMWNVFDTSFVGVFIAYFILRIRGLYWNDVYSSDLAFDILSCGACILFPRLAFFAIKNNVIVLALRGMVSDFVFFMGIAAICFSGMLFCLWNLADKVQWPLKKIIWLLVQIWFGNTSLSFSQAESFHKIFGPILMTTFAALSNTLLLTMLISILSNTFARIDENATQEYLFEFTIATIEGVKSDALFMYQPPFNLFAYALLLPLSCVLSPRALHTINVFLIRLTSFPILITIGLYERYISIGKGVHSRGKEKAQSIYNSLPRNLKKMPLVEVLVGANSTSVHEAIFDVDLSEDVEEALLDGLQFGDEEEPALRSLASRDSFRWRQRSRAGVRTRTPSIRRIRIDTNVPPSPTSGVPSISQEPLSPTPRRQRRDTSATQDGTAAQSGQNFFSSGLHVPSNLQSPKLSPLARLFSAPRFISPTSEITVVPPDSPPTEDIEDSIRRIESALEEIRNLPVQKLKDEMKELQERQARIETLLLTLTRGMRGESSGQSGGSRHSK